jgi:PST family polysaccharide transporter/lipopolysaccharide exporter
MEHENPPEGIYRRSIHGGKWILLSIAGQKFLNMLTFFVLARLLMPKDYGTITVILIIMGLFGLFSDPAFGTALTQRKGDVEQYLDTYWTFEIGRAIVIATVIACSATYIVNWFHIDPQFTWLIRSSGIFVIIGALGNIRMIYLFRNLNFSLITIRDLIGQIMYGVVAIGYALFIDRSATALFAGYVAMYLTGCATSYIIYRSRPRLAFAFNRLKDLTHFSKWVYGQNLLNYAIQYTDKIMLGRLMDPTHLGLYTKAKDLAAMPTSVMSTVIAKVGMPAFSKIQDQIEKVREGFVKSLDVLLMISLPAALIVLLEGGALVSILLGDRWLSIVIPLKIFALGNVYYSVVPVINSVFCAVGRPDVNFKTNLIQLLLSVPCMVFGLRFYGINGLAVAIIGVWLLLLFYTLFKTRRIIRLGKQHVIPLFVSGSVAAAVTVLVDVLGRNGVHALNQPLMDLGWIALIGTVYLGVLFGISRLFPFGPWSTLRSIVRELKQT